MPEEYDQFCPSCGWVSPSLYPRVFECPECGWEAPEIGLPSRLMLWVCQRQGVPLRFSDVDLIVVLRLFGVEV